MGVPSNHPIYRWIFHEKNHPSLGIPHLWNPQNWLVVLTAYETQYSLLFCMHFRAICWTAGRL